MSDRDNFTLRDSLILAGWRCIGRTPNKYGFTIYWDHPDHQPDRHGAFTQSSAIQHQRESEKHGCDCVKREALKQ